MIFFLLSDNLLLFGVNILVLRFIFYYIVGGFGGLNALAILFAIKFKIIIVAAVVAISVYYYTKLVAAKKCGANEHYRDDVASHPTASS